MSSVVQAPAAAYFSTLLDQAKEELAARGQEIFDFGVGDPIEPTPEFIRQALIRAVDPISQYPTVLGQSQLREAIAGWAKRRLDITLDPRTQVLPAAGSKEAIFHLPMSLMAEDFDGRRRVVYPTPSYPVYAGSARFAGWVPHPVHLKEENGYQLELESLGEAVLRETRLAWINYPHNPTGAGVDLGYLQRQVAVARAHNILLCADECYLDLYFDERAPPPSVLQVAQSGVLSVGSLSKRSGMTGYRSGYIAGDEATIALLKRARPNMGVSSPNFVQAAATAAWRDDEHSTQRRALFRQKEQLVVTFLKQQGYQVSGSVGAIYVWARVPVHQPAGFFERLLEHGIVVSPGESFGPGGAGYFRVALVPPLEQLQRALQLWSTIRL